ncbi:hypothetical protein [Methylobacterium sp. Leaf117]|nr:hypothetical protein [Methylobacterium sp. Leaf117]
MSAPKPLRRPLSTIATVPLSMFVALAEGIHQAGHGANFIVERGDGS